MRDMPIAGVIDDRYMVRWLAARKREAMGRKVPLWPYMSRKIPLRGEPTAEIKSGMDMINPAS